LFAIVLVSFCVGASVVLISPTSRSIVEDTRKLDFPSDEKMSIAPNGYVRRYIDRNGVEIGVIKLGDGDSVKYWFVSHHLGFGESITNYKLSDGQIMVTNGFHCCEVILDDEQPYDRDEFVDMIQKFGGS
jgi:hypothetical protein